MTSNQTIGQRIAHRLIDLDMTQSQLAKRTGRTPGTVSNWVTGRTAPDINVLPSLARVLGVPG